jgi:hypothetical protein
MLSISCLDECVWVEVLKGFENSRCASRRQPLPELMLVFVSSDPFGDSSAVHRAMSNWRAICKNYFYFTVFIHFVLHF